MWFRTRHAPLSIVVLLCYLGVFSCVVPFADPGSEEVTEDVGTQRQSVSGALAVGTELTATGNVKLREAPSASAAVLYTIPAGSKVTVEASTSQSGFYKVKHDGTVGWSAGQYYEPAGGTSGPVAAASLSAIADVNLREGPNKSYSVLLLVPAGATVAVLDPDPQSGFYNVEYQGTAGWSSGKYLTAVASPGGGGGGGGSISTIDAAMARAESAVGYSYWWGHGRFSPSGPTPATKGSCSGSCPDCSHSGSWGSDCSGLAAKVWQVPSSNTDTTVDSHPYNTASFDSDTSQWATVSRGKLKRADAMVYRSGGAGHIFVYDHGDAWGSLYAYECRGCSAGCIKGLRTASSSYHGIRRTGY